MPHAILRARIVEPRGPLASQMMALVESAQRQQAGIAGDLPTGEIDLHGFAVEGEAVL
jgi:hypothetical protein